LEPIERIPTGWEIRTRPSLGRRIFGVLLELLQTLVIAGILFLAVNLLTARIRVEGSSMEPSLHDGQFVVVNRLVYRLSHAERGDIVVFRYPLDPQRRFIKRIIGLPGDTVAIRDGQVSVNGTLLQEPYIASSPRYNGEWIVGPGRVFVLGDNRNNSSDSQNWGTLDTREIIGKAVLVYWPLSDIGLIPHFDLPVAAAEQPDL
jgi:signal peptidase I